MPAIEKKTLVSPIRAIKYSVILLFALISGFFVIGGAKASGSFFTDDFEIYDVGNLGGQGYWETTPDKLSFQVSTSTSESGIKSIVTVLSGYANGNRKNGIGLATTTSGILTFQWKCSDKDYCSIWFGLQQYDGVNDYANEYPKIDKPTYRESIILEGYGTSTAVVANSLPPNVYNKIEIEYSYATHKARARLNDGAYSAYVDLGTLQYANSIRIEASGHPVEIVSIDHILSQEEFEFWCGYDEQCQFCNTSTTCAYYNCFWSEELDYCYNTPAPEVPAMESCEGLGITERILCEIKNFFYGLFVPTPAKISELKDTLNLIKIKFPYNYILVIKDFFYYLKDNINESQTINFSILGEAGVINWSFWNSNTMLAGVSQSFLNIFRVFLKFLVILIFGLWCFNFIKRIFK